MVLQRDMVLKTIRNYRIWLIVALFVVGAILHYPQQMLFLGIEVPPSLLGLSRHTIERVYLLIPIIYASFSFGVKGGVASLAVALGIMLPRVILLSSSPNEALVESIGIIAIGAVVNQLFYMRRREQERIRVTDALLKTEEEKWRSSFNALEDVMLIIDGDYNIENINDSGLALLGKSRDEVIGEKCYQAIRGMHHPQDDCPCLQTWNTKQVGSLNRYEAKFDRYFSIKSSPVFDENGKIVKFIDLMRDITELKRAEEMLAKIIDGSSISMFVINRNHKVTHWNTALEALTGLKREEMVGTSEHWRAFYAEKRPALADLIVDGASAEGVESYYQGKCTMSSLIDGAYEAEDYYPALGSDGKWLHFTASPIRNFGGVVIAAIETLQDVTERKKAEWALQDSEKSYRELFEVALDAIWVNDAKGNILKANEATEKLTGLSSEELARSNIKTFLGEDGLRLAKNITRRLLKGETLDQPYEQHLIRRDGTEASVMLTTSPIISSGRLVAFQNIARDITEQKRMRENLRFYLHEITRAQEEERQRIARELHDSTIQTLIALLHQLESLLGDKAALPVREAKALWGFYEAIRDVVREVRRFSRDLRPSILDDLGLMPALEWLTGELTKEYGVKTSLKVTGSERRFSPEAELILFRIVQEALRNIAKHAQATKAEVKVEFDKHKVQATINDDGVGFELPQSLGDLVQTGKLGLAGMQERVQLLGGSLKLKSEVGGGTTIVARVPI
jgi:PAS domain S-box-containing protein